MRGLLLLVSLPASCGSDMGCYGPVFGYSSRRARKGGSENFPRVFLSWGLRYVGGRRRNFYGGPGLLRVCVSPARDCVRGLPVCVCAYLERGAAFLGFFSPEIFPLRVRGVQPLGTENEKAKAAGEGGRPAAPGPDQLQPVSRICGSSGGLQHGDAAGGCARSQRAAGVQEDAALAPDLRRTVRRCPGSARPRPLIPAAARRVYARGRALRLPVLDAFGLVLARFLPKLYRSRRH